MIALDTNVLIRYLVRDDEDQHRRASRLIERTIEAGDTVFIADIVLAELVWVLRGSYHLAKDRILDVLNNLYRARHASFASSERVARAIARFERGRADFADYLIGERARASGCEVVATFDRALLAEDGYEEP